MEKKKKVQTMILKLLKPYLQRNIPKVEEIIKVKFGHITARCPNRESKDEKKSQKYKGKKEFKNHKTYKNKCKKTCFMAKNSNNSED